MLFEWVCHAPQYEYTDTTYSIDSGTKLAEFELLE